MDVNNNFERHIYMAKGQNSTKIEYCLVGFDDAEGTSLPQGVEIDFRMIYSSIEEELPALMLPPLGRRHRGKCRLFNLENSDLFIATNIGDSKGLLLIHFSKLRNMMAIDELKCDEPKDDDELVKLVSNHNFHF